MISNRPLDNVGCGHEFECGLQSYSEKASSIEADQIAGIIGTTIHGKQFVANALNFSVISTNVIPAFRSDERTWRSEVLIRGIVSG
jgi:hypothetical protein